MIADRNPLELFHEWVDGPNVVLATATAASSSAREPSCCDWCDAAALRREAGGRVAQ